MEYPKDRVNEYAYIKPDQSRHMMRESLVEAANLGVKMERLKWLTLLD